MGLACSRLVILKTRIVRIVSTSKYNSVTAPLFKTLTSLQVKNILKLQELQYYYRYENNILSYYIANILLNTSTSIYSRATRTQNKIHL